MEEGKEHTHYPAEYLRKYLDGELTGPEMQALEKAALEDPFLSDALEGLEASEENRSSLTSDLTDLQQRLSERISTINRKKGILFRLSEWQVAASVFFIIGAAALTYILIFKRTDQSKIAITTPADSGARKSEPAPATIASDSGKPEKIMIAPDLSKADSAEYAYQPAVKKKKSRLQDEKSVIPAPTAEAASGFSKLKVEEPAMDSRRQFDKTSSIAKNADSVFIPSSKTRETALQGKAAGILIQSGRDNEGKLVTGVVLDTTGNPIPSATVTIPGTNNGAVTDDNGFFRIYLNNGNRANDIAIQSIGYESYTGKLSPGNYDSNTYRLRNAGSLNEVIVTGYAAVKKKDITGSVTQVSTKNSNLPQGWDSLYHYVDTNKKITTADSVLKGEELISFVVSKNGELSSFKIIKSVSPAHDAEIIRLIKSGPPLKIQKGRKQKCQISILFN